MTAAVLDAAVFDDLQDAMGEEFVEDLVTTFLEEAPGMIGGLKAAVESADADAFRRAAHSLKSNAQVFGAAALGDLARAMELGALSDTGPDQIGALEHCYADTAAALLEWRDG